MHLETGEGLFNAHEADNSWDLFLCFGVDPVRLELHMPRSSKIRSLYEPTVKPRQAPEHVFKRNPQQHKEADYRAEGGEVFWANWRALDK